MAFRSDIKTGEHFYDSVTQQEIVITLVTYNNKVFFKPDNPFIQYAVWIYIEEAMERFKRIIK